MLVVPEVVRVRSCAPDRMKLFAAMTCDAGRVTVPVAVKDEKVAVPANAGEVEKTARLVPVSSVSAVERFDDVNDPSDAALPTEVTIPVKLALVVTLLAVKARAVPVILVPTSVDGVPRFGVTNTGFVENTTTPVPVSSVRELRSVAESAVVVARLCASVNSARDAV